MPSCTAVLRPPPLVLPSPPLPARSFCRSAAASRWAASTICSRLALGSERVRCGLLVGLLPTGGVYTRVMTPA